MRRGSRSSRSWPSRSSATRTATCSCRAAARWPTCCASRSRPSSASSACAATPSATCSAASSAASATSTQREAREVGEKAVQFAMWGERNGSVAIRRSGDYAVDYQLVPLADVAGKTRVMDDAFIADNGSDVTDAFASLPAPAARLGAARGRTGCGRRRWPRCSRPSAERRLHRRTSRCALGGRGAQCSAAARPRPWLRFRRVRSTARPRALPAAPW